MLALGIGFVGVGLLMFIERVAKGKRTFTLPLILMLAGIVFFWMYAEGWDLELLPKNSAAPATMFSSSGGFFC